MPKVSIIVPIYNVEKYLERCIESLINQSLREIEIILIDDGSKDKSVEISKKYQQKYPEKIVFLEKENGGSADARNYGISYAKGEYIAFLDSDDYAQLDTYKKMYDKAKEENSDIVECDFFWEYPNKRKIDNGSIYKNKKEMLIYARVMPWNKLIKRELLVDNKIQFPKGLRYEDVEFSYKLVPFCNKVSFIKEPLIHYIQRKSSVSYMYNEGTKDIFTILENVIQYYKTNNLYDEYKSELEYIYTRYLLCSSLKRMVKIKDKKVKKELLKKTWDKLNDKFPSWKKNEILNKNKSIKNLYMRTVNKVTYNIYCLIFGIVK